MAKYRVLSLDGGGLRGLITVRMLEQLADDPAIAGWLDKVDLIAGTSSGGIIALGIAAGKPLSELAALYHSKGQEIFDDSIWDDIKDMGKIIGADYSSKVLKRELKEIFGTTKLGSLQKKVAITAFDLDNEAGPKRTWKPKIFHNYSGPGNDGRYSAANVALYTSAAPTYFPSANGYIDGGVFANNPSMVALVQAISKKNTPQERAKLDEVVLLSIGTGISLKYIKEKKLDWGYAQWAQPMLEVLMDGVAGISDYQCQQILDDRYHRLQVTFAKNEKIDMDNVKKIHRMDEIGRSHNIGETRKWIQKHWL
ncbi:MAG: CBASS cGAMP-activated phospholipase [Halioglobus sp.]